MKKSNLKKTRFARCRVGLILVGFIVLGFLAIWLDPECFVACLVMFLFLMLVIESERQGALVLEKRDHQKLYGPTKAKRKADANVRAQLGKPKFETRLQNFVSTGSPAPVEQDEEFVSKTKFWLLEDYFYEKTPARPVELLRHLLQRIAKLVGRS